MYIDVGGANLTSIFLICFRSDAPYLVPYFPATPTFLVRFVILELSDGYEDEEEVWGGGFEVGFSFFGGDFEIVKLFVGDA
jgi:hypothetical protein